MEHYKQKTPTIKCHLEMHFLFPIFNGLATSIIFFLVYLSDKIYQMKEFKLREGAEYIELNNLLQQLGWVGTGGEAKIRIKQEEIKVNGAVELRVRKKMRVGDSVQFQNEEGKVI